jgi:hypothetical protein
MKCSYILILCFQPPTLHATPALIVGMADAYTESRSLTHLLQKLNEVHPSTPDANCLLLLIARQLSLENAIEWRRENLFLASIALFWKAQLVSFY